MNAKTRKRILRCAVWLTVVLLILAFCPGPVEGNWKSLSRGRSPQCGCDSYNYDRFANGAIFSVSSAHPPPVYLGPYHSTGFGAYEGTILYSPHDVSVHGFVTLLFAVEFTSWGQNPELILYVRNFSRKAQETTKQNADKLAVYGLRDLGVARASDGRIVITKFKTKEISLEDIDKIASKFQEQKCQVILIESDLPIADFQPLVTKLEAHGLKVRVEPRVVFR
jgi:hypothetical protein